jgi:hypothetical protein
VTAASELHVTKDEVSVSNNGNASITFNPEHLAIDVGEIVTVTVDVDPSGEQVNGAMIHLSYNPSLLEITNAIPTNRLTTVLEPLLIDNSQGTVRYSAGVLGHTIVEEFSILTLSLRLKETTTGTTINLVDTFPGTDISGPEGSVLGEMGDITLETQNNGHKIFLPVLLQN